MHDDTRKRHAYDLDMSLDMRPLLPTENGVEENSSGIAETKQHEPHGEHGENSAYLIYGLSIGAVLGILAGFLISTFAKPSEDSALIVIIGMPGRLMVRALKALILPLVSASMILAVSSLGSFKNTGTLARRIFSFYGITLVLAALCGLFFVNVIRPGGSVSATGSSSSGNANADCPTCGTWHDTILRVLDSLIPENFVSMAANTDLLGIMSTSIALGFALVAVGEVGQPLIKAVQAINAVTLVMIQFLMKLLPVCVFSMVAASMGSAANFFQLLSNLALFVVTVLLALLVHAGLLLPAVYFAFVRENPYKYLRHYTPALLTAFATSSSAATLPVTMKCARERARIPEKIVQFVLPLGFINMDGSCLYEAIVGVFVAQAAGVKLTFAQLLVVVIVSVLVAVGAAPIPNAGTYM